MENQVVNTEQCCVNTCDQPLDLAFWDNQYQNNTLGWDLGEVSKPIKEYIDQLENKNLRILIPGCGNTYEADYLLKSGFKNITVLDLSPTLVNVLKKKYESNKEIKIVQGDFFEHQGQYDLIFEQTFFCALNPSLRQDYALKMAELLVQGGKLVGLLFDKEFEIAGPPFGGCKCKYVGFFENHFSFKTFEPCYNSNEKRKDIELFIIFVKK